MFRKATRQRRTAWGRQARILVALTLAFVGAAWWVHAEEASTPLASRDLVGLPLNTDPVAVDKAAGGGLATALGLINTLQNTLKRGAVHAEELPIPLPSVDAPPPVPQQHVIGLAKPEDAADVRVEEDDGLISLMVRDASLRQVLALVAETQNLNIVFALPADVPITASFDRVPWQRVIESLLSVSGHTWTVNGDVIFVTSNTTANLVPPEAAGRQTQLFELDFISSVDVQQTVQGLLSPSGLSWVMEISPDDNRRTREAVAVVDFPANMLQISHLIAQMDQPPRQVLIETHILQVELKDDCRNGVNFDALVSWRGNEIRPQSVGFSNPAASPAFFIQATGAALDGLVQLLQSTTDAKTLASPRLLVLNGQLANIQIGEQLGFRVTTTTQTSTLESVQFLNVGVVLTVTPRITRDGRVLMRIKPKVSTREVNPETGLPEEETTEVETDVIVDNGCGVVIGGLIQEKDVNLQSKIPYLGDLPYAGVLFQKRQVVKERTEIIVALIPHVQPYSPVQFQRNNFDFMRTAMPLTHGPLCRTPRPFEARLPDTFTNPKWGCVNPECRQPGCQPGRPPTLSQLTPEPLIQPVSPPTHPQATPPPLFEHAPISATPAATSPSGPPSGATDQAFRASRMYR